MAQHAPPPWEADDASHPAATNPQRADLVQIWAGLQAAASTDSRARMIVDYLSADAARLFGASGPGSGHHAG